MTDDEPTVEIPESELYDLYDTLADATAAAQMGSPNECSRLAAEAKRRVEAMHSEYA